MTDDPRWHGWATPEHVREMMEEMYEFLIKNGEICHYMTVSAANVGSKEIFGQKSKNCILNAQLAMEKWRD